MTFVTRTAAIAEAAALDVRGQVTLVALEPQAWVPTTLPTVINFALVIIAESDGESEDIPVDDGETSQVSITITDPNGTVEFFSEGSFPAQHPDPTLPPRVQFVFQLSLTVNVAGAHVIKVVWTRTDRDQFEWVRELRVRAPA